jgi:hypothetical protein
MITWVTIDQATPIIAARITGSTVSGISIPGSDSVPR